MKTIEIEIPDGKRAEWVNGVLTLVEDKPIEYKFKVGDIAVLEQDTAFKQGNGVCLIYAGAEVEIMSVSDCINDTDKLYEVKYQNGTSVVKGSVLIPVEPKPVEYKFKVGDKVKCAQYPHLKLEVKECFELGDGEPFYSVEGESGSVIISEDRLEFQDITERIKTFADAYVWCKENHKGHLTAEHDLVLNNWGVYSYDLLAYLKLRIITCALNEGWEPTFEAGGYIGYYDKRLGEFRCCAFGETYLDSSIKLRFKSARLAAYAAKQFRDIYADFCGCKKGGEK